MKKRRDYREMKDVELSPEVDAQVQELTKAADEEGEAARVNMRWGREQIDLIKKAANLMGIPYQTYIKHVVIRQAAADLSNLNAAAGIH